MRGLLTALLLVGCSQPVTPPFTNVSITLPESATMLPPGPHIALATATCTACHSADMMTNQPRLTRAQWQANVEKMVKVYKANIDPADVEPIVDYLVAINAQAKPTARTVPPRPSAP